LVLSESTDCRSKSKTGEHLNWALLESSSRVGVGEVEAWTGAIGTGDGRVTGIGPVPSTEATVVVDFVVAVVARATVGDGPGRKS
jgi:hypothetical protein